MTDLSAIQTALIAGDADTLMKLVNHLHIMGRMKTTRGV